MSKENIKKQLHSYIDKIEDEVALNLLQEAAQAYSTKQPDIIDELTTAQQQRLDESLTQAKEGKVISNEEVLKKTKEWFTR